MIVFQWLGLVVVSALVAAAIAYGVYQVRLILPIEYLSVMLKSSTGFFIATGSTFVLAFVIAFSLLHRAIR